MLCCWCARARCSIIREYWRTKQANSSSRAKLSTHPRNTLVTCARADYPTIALDDAATNYNKPETRCIFTYVWYTHGVRGECTTFFLVQSAALRPIPFLCERICLCVYVFVQCTKALECVRTPHSATITTFRTAPDERWRARAHLPVHHAAARMCCTRLST